MKNNVVKANLSYWEQASFFNEIDVAIIGSGIVGLNAAITLKERQPKLKVAVLERGVLPIGASTRNAGFACFGSMTELLDDLIEHTEDEVVQLVEKRWQGLNKLRRRIGDAQLGFKPLGGHEIFLEKGADRYEACMNRMDWLNDLLADVIGIKTIFSDVSHLIPSFGFDQVRHMILNTAEGQINTGEMMRRLLQLAQSHDIEIYNGFDIQRIEETEQGVVLTAANDWRIKTRQVLVANNGFAKQLCDLPAIKPARNQVLITKPIAGLPFKGTFHYDSGYYYFRNVGTRVLFGGGRNLDPKEEETTAFGTTPKIKNALLSLLEEVILPDKKFEVEMWWSGILGVGEQKKPIVKQISDNVFVAVRLGGMGVAIGSLIGMEGAELVLKNV